MLSWLWIEFHPLSFSTIVYNSQTCSRSLWCHQDLKSCTDLWGCCLGLILNILCLNKYREYMVDLALDHTNLNPEYINCFQILNEKLIIFYRLHFLTTYICWWHFGLCSQRVGGGGSDVLLGDSMVCLTSYYCRGS